MQPDLNLDPDGLADAAAHAAALDLDLRELAQLVGRLDLPDHLDDRRAALRETLDRAATELAATAEACRTTAARARAIDATVARTVGQAP